MTSCLLSKQQFFFLIWFFSFFFFFFNLLALRVDPSTPIEKGSKHTNGRVASPASVPIHLSNLLSHYNYCDTNSVTVHHVCFRSYRNNVLRLLHVL